MPRLATLGINAARSFGFGSGPQYSVSAAGAVTSVNEGSSLTFNVTTTNVANTTLYWSINNITTSNIDFSATSGSFSLTGGSGSFNVTPTADATTEGAETFTVSVRSGSISGTVVATSSSITVNDTSLTPTISSVTGANANEGSSASFSVVTANIANSTSMSWSINHISTNASDFSATSGTFTISGNAGSFSIGIIADGTTEGPETYTVTVSGGGATSLVSSSYTINDTSVTTYTISAAAGATSVNEGSSLTFNVGGTGITNGTYYWTIDSNAGDFGTSSGSFSITSNTGSFSVTPTADYTTEGAETFTVSVRSGSISGTILVTSSSITINDTSVPTYSVAAAAGATSINEGSSLTFNVTTQGVANSTTLYWTVTNSGDFGTTSGSFTITSNAGSFSVTPTADLTTEGAETFTVSVRTGSTSGTVVATSSSITINDTSVPTYSVAATSGSVNEGSSLTFNVTTQGVANSTTLYWTISNSTSSNADFSATSGSFTITSNAGSFSVTPTADYTTEGAETFTVDVRTGSTSGTIVASSGSVTINDTSVPTYSVAAAAGATSVDEGSSLTFNVTTQGVANSTTLYWTVTNSGDFGTTSGSFTITSNAGSFSVTPTADLTTEGAETFTVSVRTGSTSGTVVATSSSITINDTSTTPAPTYSVAAAGAATSVNEGSSLTFNVTTTNVANSTTLYWYVNNSTTANADFSATNGSFTITSNAGSFSVGPVTDHLSESGETFTVSISTTSLGTAVATSGSITVNNVAYYSINSYPSISITSLTAASSISVTKATWNPGAVTSQSSYGNFFYGTTVGSQTTSTGAYTYTTSSSDNGRYFKFRDQDPDGMSIVDSNVIGPIAIPVISSVTGASANEGASASFSVVTANISDVTLMSWSINHISTNASDFVTTSGTFYISSNAGSFSVGLSADATTEGSETYTVTVSGGGATAVTSSSYTINDTSLTPPTINSITGASANEGASASFSVSTTSIANGTLMSWSINHNTTSSADFTATSSTFTISNNAGSFSIGILADHLTEGTENYTVTVSGGGAALTSASYNAYDTSLTPTISGYWSPSSLSFPSNLSSTFYWTVANYTSDAGSYIIVNDGGNTPTLLSTSTVYASSGNTGSVTFNNPGTGYAYGYIPNYFQNCTVPITISPPAGISITYPTLVAHGTGFTWSLTGGYPGETGYVSWSGAASGSTSFTLDGSGSYNNSGTGDFGTSYGSITNIFTFSRSSGSVSKTVTNQPPTPTVSYPSSIAKYPTTFSWSISGGLSGESWSVTWSGANSGSYSSTLDGSGSASSTGSYYNNAGTVNLTFTFSGSSRVNTGTVYKTITVT